MIIKQGLINLESFLEKSAIEKVFPGACFGIITKEESGFGFTGNAQTEPTVRKMREDSIFDIASLTKVIATTTSIITLIENGDLSLSDRVKDILPDFKHKDTTVLQLLTHTSGLPTDVKFYKSCSSPEEIINELYNTDLYNEPDKIVLYSDLNFMLLGLIVQKLSLPLDKFTEKYIFNPLDMQDTCFNPSEEKWNRCAATEYREERGFIVGRAHDGNAFAMGGVSGHAGLFSTTHDLGNFISMILNGGWFKGRKVLSESSIRLMGMCFTDGLNEKRGLGWRLRSQGDTIGSLVSEGSLYHTGFTGTSVLIDSTLGFGFVLLTNRIHPSRNNQSLLGLREHINNLAAAAIG